MHSLDYHEMLGEKAWWKLHKNATGYCEQIPETAPRETANAESLISNLTNHPNNTSEI